MISSGATSGKRRRFVKSHLDCYLSIVLSIKASGGLPSEGMSKRTRTNYLKTLRIEGVVEKIGYGTYAVNEELWQKFRSSKQVANSSQHGNAQVESFATCSSGNKGLIMAKKKVVKKVEKYVLGTESKIAKDGVTKHT